MNSFWQLIAGLGVFLLGMSFIERALIKLGGASLKTFLQKHTQNPLKAVFGGTLATAILQSSSVISLIVLAFVGARMIQMKNALGIIIGANLGTTFTGWIVAFFGFKLALDLFSYPFLAVGLLGMVLLDRRTRAYQTTKIVAGFGFLLFGLSFMKAAMHGVGTEMDLAFLQGHHIVVYFIFGALFTAVIQSSSASMALTLTALSMGAIEPKAALAVVIGADLGTTATVLLGAIGGTAAKKRVALFHFIFNFLVDLAALSAINPLLAFAQFLLPSDNPLYILVACHNLFNLFGIIIFLPLLPTMANYLERMFTQPDPTPAQYINKVEPGITEASLEVLKLEARHLVNLVVNLNMSWMKIARIPQAFPLDEKQFELQPSYRLKERYNDIKVLEAEILRYMLKLREDKEFSATLPNLDFLTVAVREAVRSVKAIKNIRHDVEGFMDLTNVQADHQLSVMRDKLAVFYRQLGEVWASPEMDSDFEDLIELKQVIETDYQAHTQAIYAQVGSPALNLRKNELSTLLNVARQIYTSNTALLNATKELMLTPEQINVFENMNPITP